MKEYRVRGQAMFWVPYPEGLIRSLLLDAGFDTRRGYMESREWGKWGPELVLTQEDEANAGYEEEIGGHPFWQWSLV